MFHFPVLFCGRNPYSSGGSGLAGVQPVFAFYLVDLVNEKIDHRCCKQRTLHGVFLVIFVLRQTGTLARYIPDFESEFP